MVSASTTTKKRENMTTIHLLIEDDFVEEFMSGLPKDKITVIEEDFQENKKFLHDTLQDYNSDKSNVIPYYNSMKEMNNWLKEKEV